MTLSERIAYLERQSEARARLADEHERGKQLIAGQLGELSKQLATMAARAERAEAKVAIWEIEVHVLADALSNLVELNILTGPHRDEAVAVLDRLDANRAALASEVSA